jgi:hypothetical protein
MCRSPSPDKLARPVFLSFSRLDTLADAGLNAGSAAILWKP